MAASPDLGRVLGPSARRQEPEGSSPPTALALAERHNEMISDVFGIQTVSELRSNKYFAVAGARVVLGNKI